MSEPQNRRRALTIITLTAFLNFIGLTLAIPIFTPLCLDQTGGIIALGTSMPVRTTILGLILGIFPLCQFFTSPLLGALSDRSGRKKLLLWTTVGVCTGYLLMALSIVFSSLWLAFASRIISGCFSGSLAVTQSAIVDLSDEKTRTKDFGLLGAAFGASLFIGPAVGGFLSDPQICSVFSYATPFWLAAFLTGMTLLLIMFWFAETLGPEKRRHVPFEIFLGPVNIARAFRDPLHRKMFLVVFFLGFGFNFFTQFFQVYLIEAFAATRSQLGIALSWLGVCSIATQAFLVRPISDRFSPKQILPVMLLLHGLTFPALLMVPKFWLLFPVMIFIPLFNGIAIPNLTSLVCSLTGPQQQGEILGINQSVTALAQFLPPLIGGYIVGHNFTIPLWLTAASILAAWVLALRAVKAHPAK